MSPAVAATPATAAARSAASLVSRLVVLAPNWLGDLLLAIPALMAVREWQKGAHLAVAARHGLAAAAALIEGVDEVVELDGRARMVREDATRLARGRFDAALLLPNSFHAALTAWRAGVPERWGYRRDLRGALLTRGVPRPHGGGHQSAYYASLVQALGAGRAVSEARLVIPDEARSQAAALLRDRGWTGGGLCALAPGAAFGPAKCWPPERAGALAARLAARGLTPVFIGAPGDRRGVEEAVRACLADLPGSAPRPIDLAGATDLATAAALLSLCDLVVANDSGAMHLAAAAGAPVVGIFGPTNEHATSPLPHPGGARHAIVAGEAWCRPCQLRACPLDHRCMRSIGVDRVMEVALGTVRGSGA